MAKITSTTIDQILLLIGGSKNIIVCGNCMTRLRLTLKDRQLIQHESLKKIPGVMGIVNGDDQLQIILEPGKAQTASEMMNKVLSSEPQPQHESTQDADLHVLASQAKQQM
ncbi:TPA: PTS transporter subunit EIIB, partial [Yersinia enterocolitica]|nr:PTS transporter subunit EIIB [Yersinia enterocolitica]HDL6972836.1 PTS transporter subunit EIIB [Yersinia enterocolitica]HDL6989367.1 PTS transporter subunit EIIB [Yersinia enterocolitica]HDL6998056.1 PTS transporter subunit EIIB [Yersinia enterocolitica]HDL7097052.1 PTS transporter subunit EIIB [Yersinia enterocolitica]